MKLTRALILTHDVDWPIQGPGVEHVLARKDRFASEIIAKVEKDGSIVNGYSQIMRNLLSGGWEVSLHCNSTSSLQEVNGEKSAIERASGQAVLGSRVHYLKVAECTFANLSAAGIKYDSSLSFNKEQIDKRNTGFLFKNDLVVFPVTFMDAYLFSYMHQSEETVTHFF